MSTFGVLNHEKYERTNDSTNSKKKEITSMKQDTTVVHAARNDVHETRNYG